MGITGKDIIEAPLKWEHGAICPFCKDSLVYTHTGKSNTGKSDSMPLGYSHRIEYECIHCNARWQLLERNQRR